LPKSGDARAAGASALPRSQFAARRMISCNVDGQMSARNNSTIEAST
jgi:hypothetical protein